ncbi:MAG TPA: Fis family transcriptional regulator [Gammaproteobacteria bacterium]|jgi:competence protein ComEA|nr:helix-hairpin-helix domain-containing protein [Arenicellales bacterium]HCY13219.1 Fis family transcriptional regulator [Gammaproteobacteria bacterium]|tara:strand:+ start:961 stop:1242 length:282 start_codon:yes stop_codon:yes gene_type:complete
MEKYRYIPLLIGALLLGSSVWAEPVDINTSDADVLAEHIVGVGPVLAEAIIAYRAAYGPFQSVEDLLQVTGIGPKVLEKNTDNLQVGGISDAN